MNLHEGHPASSPAIGSTTIERILVCLDQSPLAEACLDQARWAADAFGAEITLLHVLTSPEEDPSVCPLDALDWELRRREAQKYLTGTELLLAARGFRRVTTEVAQGRPAQQIVHRALALRADLTVLSSHGEGGLGPNTLGSTTLQVLASAPSSVLVIPTARGPYLPAPPRRILVAVDGSVRSQRLLPEVGRLAQFHDAEVLLVHVVAEPRPNEVLAAQEDLDLALTLADHLEAAAELYLSRLRTRLLSSVQRCRQLVLRAADARRTLLEAANQWRADLMVLSAHGTTCDAEHPFGSFASYALAHGSLPTLVLQDVPADERPRHEANGPANGRPVALRVAPEVSPENGARGDR